MLCDKTKQCTADIIFDTRRKGNHCSILTPTVVGGRCFLPSEICAQSDPPPSKNTNFDRCSIMTNRKSTTIFPTSYRWSAYVTPKSRIESETEISKLRQLLWSVALCLKRCLCRMIVKASVIIALLLLFFSFSFAS